MAEIEWRKAESSRIREAYPDRIPVVVGKSDIADINDYNNKKKRYLVPADMTVDSFGWVIREKVDISMKMNILLFVKNVLQPDGATMLAIFAEHKDEDGFLYVTYGLSKRVDHRLTNNEIQSFIQPIMQSGIIAFLQLIIRNMKKSDPRFKKHVRIGYLIKKFRTSNWKRRRCALALKDLSIMDSSNQVLASVRFKNLFSLIKCSL
ncbi:uncharacterized protein LOC141655033 [Silene latifolia]|uniref:uncharacterized protein LOC141655033 n=1 Tax=Silene latifolia TaxID=37657 RepID=UPI003D78922F